MYVHTFQSQKTIEEALIMSNSERGTSMLRIPSMSCWIWE